MKVLRAGLIGAHMSRTRLPKALQIMCDLNGLTLEFELRDTAGIDGFQFDHCVDTLRRQDWSGVIVTHLFKTDAARYAAEGMQAEVAHLGASNTLVFGDHVAGFNTDFTGFKAAFEPISERGPVVMVGAGGVVRSLRAALVGLGVEGLAIYDVDTKRAADLACSIGPPARAIPLNKLEISVSGAAGLVNATPMGMAEYPGSAIDVTWIGSQQWAFDAVYKPTDTMFMKACTAASLTTISGFELFKHMAIRSFECYTSIPVERAVVLPLLEELRP